MSAAVPAARRPSPSSVPPARVILLGIDTPIGLAIVRELGRSGIEVHGLGRGRHAIGRYSRFLARAHVRRPGEAVIAQLAELGAELGADTCLLAIAEGDIDLLNRHRGRLGGLKLLVPAAAQMACVVNKDIANAHAAAVGIELPRQWAIASAPELDTVAAQAGYPVVLKWPNPNLDAARLARFGLRCEKARYCYDAAELRAVLAPYLAVGECPLVQEYARGHGLGQFLFMHRGEALLRFQHRRVNEWPPEGGVSCTCAAVPLDRHAELMERSIALLRRIGWEGAAMVEYRHDPATGRSVFMEINGRFWGSLPLAYHSGAAFARLTVEVLGQGRMPALPPPRFDLRARFVFPELRRLARILFRPGLIQDRSLRFVPGVELARFLLAFADPRSRYYVFEPRDPLPFLADLWFAAQRVWRR